jgi:hypothetical protein
VNNKIQGPGTHEEGPDVGDFSSIASIGRASYKLLAGTIRNSTFCPSDYLRVCPALVVETGAHLVRFDTLIFYRFLAVLAIMHSGPTT